MAYNFVIMMLGGFLIWAGWTSEQAYANYDNYVGVGTWTKIGLNNTDYKDQGAFDVANNYFVAPADGT